MNKGINSQVVYYYDKEGKMRIQGGDPDIEVEMYYDNGVKVKYINQKIENKIKEITNDMKNVRLSEEEKRSMPDKYILNEKTGKMVLKKFSKLKI